jgi:sec-independent protein translocase protein TatA
MGIGVTELLLILGIVIVLFGTRKLKEMGGDLGGAIKSFRSAMREGEEQPPATSAAPPSPGTVPPATGAEPPPGPGAGPGTGAGGKA